MERDRERAQEIADRLGFENPGVRFYVEDLALDVNEIRYFIIAETFQDPPPAIVGVPNGWQVYSWYKGDFGIWINDVENVDEEAD